MNCSPAWFRRLLTKPIRVRELLHCVVSSKARINAMATPYTLESAADAAPTAVRPTSIDGNTCAGGRQHRQSENRHQVLERRDAVS